MRTVAQGADAAWRLLPTEGLRCDAIAVEQAIARPWQAVLLVVVGVVAQTELDRIEAERLGELIHRRFEGEAAGAEARPTHGLGLRSVDPHQPVRGRDIAAGIERARRPSVGVG